MWRIHPFRILKWVWTVLIGGVVLGVGTDVLFELIKADGQFHFSPYVQGLLSTYRYWIGVGTLGLVALTLWAWRDEHMRFHVRASFALNKPATKLHPADLDFQPLRPGWKRDLNRRPYYPTYIPRRAVPYESITEKDPRPIYDESDLAQALQEGKGVIFIGQPLDGKSRTLYEIVRRLKDYQIVRPFKRSPLPSDDTFSFLKGHRVILFMDDLNDYVGSSLDLREFCRKLTQFAETWTVVATCRDGPELGTVREAIGTGLHRFYEDIPLKLGLFSLSNEEKAHLASGTGREWLSERTNLFPTPGSITMEEPLEAMRQRFQMLRLEHKETLWGLKLLASAGVLPFTHHRLEVIFRNIFGRTLSLDDCLIVLAEQDFLRRPVQDPIQPEPAYLQDIVTYREGKNPCGRLPCLGKYVQGNQGC